MKKLIIVLFLINNAFIMHGQSVQNAWISPGSDVQPWVYWYWMYGAEPKEAITADLEAMHESGISGAYLMTIKGVPLKPYVEPSYQQLTPQWWDIIKYTVKEANRLGIKLAINACDGWATAGGQEITPEMSMQYVVWSRTDVEGNRTLSQKLNQPVSNRNYYRDIATFAFRLPQGWGVTTRNVPPVITCSLPDKDVSFLSGMPALKALRTDSTCWIQYSFEKPFTCRSIRISPEGNNYQAQRLVLQVSDDGRTFREVTRFQPPRQGWTENVPAVTYSIPVVSARYFRFIYNKEGSEPGSEDMDPAKFSPQLRLKAIELSSEARIQQYEGKNGSVWRLSPATPLVNIPASECVHPIDISEFMDKNGVLNWKVPAGKWAILRMGYTTTGSGNSVGGGGFQLECDKMNPAAAKLQFDSWFGQVHKVVGDELFRKVVKIFHVDSWECRSQNWSPVFGDEFRKRRGYDVTKYFPVMAGFPVDNVRFSEKVLLDVRRTISELIQDNFYKTLQSESHALGCQFSAECVSPIAPIDAFSNNRYVDIPMGEFWFRSPTHDKPNDVLDAVSGAHIYGKNIVQSEAFTEIRLLWDEHPRMFKKLQDLEYSSGINRLALHVMILNPWLDRHPGMTLDNIGSFFQRDQTWWKQGRAWIDYATRCQSMLQIGKPVVDVAVFTGEDIPSRAVLPERLVPFLPGIVGQEVVRREKMRLLNKGVPMVTHAGLSVNTNTPDPIAWGNVLKGYAYDCINRDALLSLAKVENKRLVLPGGMSYGLLIVPGARPMSPNAGQLSDELKAKIKEFVRAGLPVLTSEKLPWTENNFNALGVEKDCIVREPNGDYASGVVYSHRRLNNEDIYFIANQNDTNRTLKVSLRCCGKQPELWNPVNGETGAIKEWSEQDGRTQFALQLYPQQSFFIVLKDKNSGLNPMSNGHLQPFQIIDGPWKVSFEGMDSSVIFSQLTDWRDNRDNRIKYFSGTAVYRNNFNFPSLPQPGIRYFIDFDDVNVMAKVKINGVNCGTIWTYPLRTEITRAIRPGINTVEIEVVNTWANHMYGYYNKLLENNSDTWTIVPYLPNDMFMHKSGLTGEVRIVKMF